MLDAQKVLKYSKHAGNYGKLRFLSIATNKHTEVSLRSHQRCIMVDEFGSGHATCGSRLHYASEIELDPGFYGVIKTNTQFVEVMHIGNLDDFEYPNVHQILDEYGERDCTVIDITDSTSVHGYFAQIVRTLHVTGCLNFYFWEEAYENMPDVDKAIVQVPHGTEPIKIFTDECAAALMPIRM